MALPGGRRWASTWTELKEIYQLLRKSFCQSQSRKIDHSIPWPDEILSHKILLRYHLLGGSNICFVIQKPLITVQ